MDTHFAISPDGVRIAYDRRGSGPPLILLHGGGGSRQDWHEAGYTDRLKESFSVVVVDLRGHGESDLVTDPAAYHEDKMCQDILAVADACQFDSFMLWGMSFGSKVARYLAVKSDRLTKLILLSATLGPGVSGPLRQDVYAFMEHWPPILEAQRQSTLDYDSLSEADKQTMDSINVRVVLAWGQAMLDWPVSVPADFRCPTLWLAGSEDPFAMESLREYQDELPGSQVQVQVIPNLDHNQLFEEIDTVFPILLAFSGEQ